MGNTNIAAATAAEEVKETAVQEGMEESVSTAKHTLQFITNVKSFKDALTPLKSVDSETLFMSPAQKKPRTENVGGKTVTYRTFNLSCIGKDCSVTSNVECATTAYQTDGQTKSAIGKLTAKDLSALFVKKELMNLIDVLSGTEAMQFTVNTTDNTCRVVVKDAAVKDGFKADVMLPLSSEAAVGFSLGGDVLASAVVTKADTDIISMAAGTITVDAAKEEDVSVAIGFNGPALKWLTTNRVTFMLGEIRECELKPFEGAFVRIKANDFKKAVSLIPQGGKVKLTLIGKESDAEVKPSKIAFQVNNGTVFVAPLMSSVLPTTSFDNFANLCKGENTSKMSVDKDEIVKGLKLLSIGGSDATFARFVLENGNDIILEEYKASSNKKKRVVVKGKVEISEELASATYLFSTKQFLLVLENLQLSKLVDDNGHEVGNEKVNILISDKLFNFTNVKEGSYLAFGNAPEDKVDNKIAAEQKKAEKKTK